MNPYGQFHLLHQKGNNTFRFQAQFDCRIIGVFGPSGSGKTTLFNLLSGLENTGEGLVRIGNEEWQNLQINLPPHRRAVGYLFQEDRLFPNLTVGKNLLYGNQWRRHSRAPVLSCQEVAERLEIDLYLKRYPDQLSGGQRRRVALGRAFLSNPELLLLDEPFIGLDARLRNKLISTLMEFHQKLECPLFISSHNQYDLDLLTMERWHIENGKLHVG